MKIILKIFAMTLASMLVSCATGINVQVTKPSEVDLKGARSIAVLPFSFPSQIQTPGLDPYQAAILRLWYYGNNENQEERALAVYAEGVFSRTLIASKFYTVKDSSAFRSAINQGDASNAKKLIDAEIIVTGRIDEFSNVIKDKSYTDKKGKWISKWEGNITVSLTYEAILAKTGEILTSKTFEDTKYTSDPDYTKVRNEGFDKAKDILDGFSGQIKRQLSPYTENQTRYLADDKTKNPKMDEAKKLVVDKFYKQALEIYTAVYNEDKNFAAGFNAAILIEILGDLDGAIKAMDNLTNASLDKKAANELERMKKTKFENEAAALQLKK